MRKNKTILESSVPGLSRRQFLQLAQQLAIGASAYSICPLALRADDLEALKLTYIDASEGLMLAQLSRFLFPHDDLSDSVYLNVVRDIGVDIESNDETRILITDAAALLKHKAGGDWLKTKEQEKFRIFESLENTPFFRYLHWRTIESLYRSPKVWKLLGYQGSSLEYGGYLHRGFDDIDWLPE
jgi:hypothetical protein